MNKISMLFKLYKMCFSMLPLRLQTVSQGTSDCSLKCRERKKRGDKTRKSSSAAALLSPWDASCLGCCSEKVSREELTSSVPSVTFSDNHKALLLQSA